MDEAELERQRLEYERGGFAYHADMETDEAQRFAFQPTESRTCWVCLGEEQVIPRSRETRKIWAQPCLCKGSTRWVHQACIQRWIDEKQEGNISVSVSCPQCKVKYLIQSTEDDALVKVIDVLDAAANALSPLAAIGMMFSTMYLSAVTYGGFAICQIIGTEKGLELLQRMDPAVLFTTLPMIPCMLVIPNFIHPVMLVGVHRQQRRQRPRGRDLAARIADAQAAQGRQQRQGTVQQANFETSEQDGTDDAAYARAVQAEVIREDMAAAGITDEDEEMLLEVLDSNDRVPLARGIIEALALPTIAATIGSVLFRGRIQTQFHRTLVGGLLYFGVKHFLRAYYRSQRLQHRLHRKVMDYAHPPE
eukprot:Clim_evm36s243 gene=Clim_evmTU36s243